MKKLIFIATILICINSAYGQQELMKEIKNQAVVIDSLTKAIKADRESYNLNTQQSQKILKSLQDSVSVLRIELSKINKFKAENGGVQYYSTRFGDKDEHPGALGYYEIAKLMVPYAIPASH